MRRWFMVLFAALLVSAAALAGPGSAPKAEVPAGLLAVIKQIKPATALVEVNTPDGMSWGTGFVVSSDGYLVTNSHVVADAQRVTVYLKNSQKLDARIVSNQQSDDLALLQVEASAPLYTVTLGDDQSAEGVPVGVTGYPLPPSLIRLGLGLDSSTVHGIMSGRRTTEGGLFPGQVVNQMDVPISAGNSGSPVFLASTGQVVGVAVSSIRGSALNFAVPVSKVKQLLMDAGVSPSVRWADGGAETAVRPGKLSVINILPESRVIHPLFGGHELLPGLTTVDSSTYGFVAGATGALPVVTSPVDGGTRIFLGGANKTLYDYNLRTREVRAVVEAEEPFNFSGVASSDMVCMASGRLSQSTRGNAGGALMASFLLGMGSVQISEIDGSGVLMGINRRTGNLDWTVPGDFMGAPVLGQGQVFVGGLGTLACFDLATGTQVWKVRPKYKGGDREWFSPGVPAGGTLISLVVPVRVQGGLLGRGKFSLAAFDAATGAEKWRKELFEIQDHRAPLSNSVVVRPAEGRVVVVLGDRISAHSLTNGSELWKYTTRQDPKTNDADKLGKYFSREIAVADGMIYAGCEDKNLYGLSEKDGSLVWKVPTRGEVGIPTVSDGTVLVGSKDKYLYAFDSGTGALQWKYHCGTRVAGRPLVKGNFVYCGTEGGSLLDIRMPQR